MNALSMLGPSQQWLLNPRPLHQALQNPQTFAPLGQDPHPGPPSSSPPKSTHYSLLTRCKKGIAASVVVLSGHSVPEGYSHYSDLTKEHAAAQAHVTLASVEPEAARRQTVPDDIFHRLLAAGNNIDHVVYMCCSAYTPNVVKHSECILCCCASLHGNDIAKDLPRPACTAKVFKVLVVYRIAYVSAI